MPKTSKNLSNVGMILRYVVLALLLLASCHAAGGSVEMSAELTDETMAGESKLLLLGF